MPGPIWVHRGRQYALYRRADGVRLQLVRGRKEFPRVRRRSEQIPFRPGVLPGETVGDTRDLELRGVVEHADRAALQAEIDALKAALDLTGEPGILIDELPDGTRRWVEAVVENSLWVRLAPGGERASIELTGIEPTWYGPNGSAAMDEGDELDDPDVPDVVDAGAEIVLTPGADTIVDALSTTEVRALRVTLSGPADAGLEVRTAEQIGFRVPAALGAGEVLLVDEWHRQVLLNGVLARDRIEILAANRHGEYLRLRPGLNHVTVDGTVVDARLLYQRTFL